MQYAISTKNLSVKIDGKTILNKITANLEVGYIIGLLGPSGAGKTTLIRSLLGLQKIAGGEVKILGERPGSKNLKSNVGYVTQRPSVYADISVKENLDYFARLLGAKKDRVDEIIKHVELEPQANQLVGSLSGGQTTRVSLAVAMLNQPKILLLDEPTVGLDPVLRQNLWHQFKALAANGVTLVVSSHSMDEADRCDQLLFLREGELLAANTPDNIKDATKSDNLDTAFLKLARGGQS